MTLKYKAGEVLMVMALMAASRKALSGTPDVASPD